MTEIANKLVKAVWLIADEDLLQKRFADNSSFYISAQNTKAMQDNYLYRSNWHNKYLLEQCKNRDLKYIFVNEKTSTNELVREIEALICCEKQYLLFSDT